jgi:tetratricopeptide (TPR) repeat protein
MWIGPSSPMKKKGMTKPFRSYRRRFAWIRRTLTPCTYQGLVYVALNRIAEAQAAWEKARALRPTDRDVAFQLGTLYFSREQYEQAEPLLRQVYRTEPGRPNLGYYLGFIDYRKKNYRRAIDLLRANVPSDENFAQLARFYAGLAASALGFPREAQAEIEEALRLQPISPLVPPTQRFGEVLARATELFGKNKVIPVALGN